MNLEYIKRALCFHGPPMQKIWESERNDLSKLGIPMQPNYEIYQARQRYFTFQERAKRLKLHQFFARKADALYDTELKKYANVVDENHLQKVKSFYALLPPYELYTCNPNDRNPRPQQIVLERVKNGDVVYGIVKKNLPQGAISVQLLCTAEPLIRYLNHLSVKASLLPNDIGPLPLEADGSTRGYHVNDFICCEVLRILVDVDRVYVGMAGVPTNPKIKFGLVKREDLPLYFCKTDENATQRYEECLEKSREILNPNYDVLFSINGLDVNENFTLMSTLNRQFPEEELANNLRKSQANKWAFRAVAEGIERFKRGMHMEAFQCLNKALAIDPENVEGLVARGALFANRGSFQKAVGDFKTALEINKFHGNARKYMGETLVALGRSLEDDKRFEEAGKAYMDCLEIIPQHSQALECLERLNQRTSSSSGGGAGLLDNELLEHLMNLTAPLTSKSSTDADLQMKKTEKSSSSSEDSSSDSDDSNSDADAPKSNNFQKETSLSPLSKRMALHAASLQAAAAPKPLPSTAIQYDQPFYYNLAQPSVGSSGANDFKLEDDDTATRVRKLLEEASQHKKSKKKKTKHKKIKKSKKEIQKDEFEIDLAGSLFQNNYLQEAFKTIGSGDIKQKLNNDINSYEQKIADIKNRQAKLRDSLAGPTEQNSVTIDDSPPPPPSMKLPKTISFLSKTLSTTKSESSSSSFFGMESTRPSQASSSSSKSVAEAQKLSFQIRRPVKTDVFGMVRIASPLAERSRSRSLDRRDGRSSRKSRSRSRGRRRSGSRSRTRSRSRGRSSRYRSHSRGSERRRRRSRSRSYTRSRSRSRRSTSRRDRRRYRSKSRRRSHTRSRSRSRDRRQRSSERKKSVWQRLGYKPPGIKSPNRNLNKPWKHDKFDNKTTTAPNNDDGPTIEEIDEIINQAQRDRKAEIIKRDKDILKPPFKNRF